MFNYKKPISAFSACSLTINKMCMRSDHGNIKNQTNMKQKYICQYKVMVLLQNNEKRIFKCEYCTITFTDKNNKVRHIKLKHISNRFKCHQCGKLETLITAMTGNPPPEPSETPTQGPTDQNDTRDSPRQVVRISDHDNILPPAITWTVGMWKRHIISNVNQ